MNIPRDKLAQRMKIMKMARQAREEREDREDRESSSRENRNEEDLKIVRMYRKQIEFFVFYKKMQYWCYKIKEIYMRYKGTLHATRVIDEDYKDRSSSSRGMKIVMNKLKKRT